DLQVIGAVVESTRVPTEAEVDVSLARHRLAEFERLDVPLPRTVKTENGEPAEAGTACHDLRRIVRHAEVGEKIDLRRQDTQVQPLLVPAGTAARPRGAAQVVVSRDVARERRRITVDRGLHRYSMSSRSEIGAGPAGAAGSSVPRRRRGATARHSATSVSE